MRAIFGIFFVLILISVTQAAEINLGVALKELDGSEIAECTKADPVDTRKCIESTPLTLARIAIRALASRFQDEANLAPEEQIKRGALATDIFRTPKLDLNAEQIALIKRLIPKLGMSTVIVYQAMQLLDPPTVAKK